MDYPAHLEREHRLADGRQVLVRPVRPQDGRAETAFLTHLSPLARRLRFQRWRGQVEDLVRFHTRIDYDSHMGFVAESQGRIVGEAQYVANPGGRSCELGIVYLDDGNRVSVAERGWSLACSRDDVAGAKPCGQPPAEARALTSRRHATRACGRGRMRS